MHDILDVEPDEEAIIMAIARISPSPSAPTSVIDRVFELLSPAPSTCGTYCRTASRDVDPNRSSRWPTGVGGARLPHNLRRHPTFSFVMARDQCELLSKPKAFE